MTAEQKLPTDGAPADPPGSDNLVGVDGNAFAIIGFTSKALKAAGASKEYVKAYQDLAFSGDYDNVIATSMRALDGDPLDGGE